MPRKATSDVNLATIANQMKISISTVSRALRDAEGIHPETRAKIIELAESLGYDSPSQRKNRENGAPHQIMALAQCSTATDQQYLAGISRASVALNLTILSHHVTAQDCETVLNPQFQPTAMKSGLVEGLILIHRWPQKVAERLSSKWLAASIIHQYPGTSIDYIGIDDRLGMWALVKHLCDTGHERIGFFGFCRDMSWACSRFSGFVEAATRMGLPYEPKNVIELSLEEALAPGIFAESGWGDQVKARLKIGVDAWVCSSSIIGQTLCRYFLDQGLRIPDDVAITGYHQNQPTQSGLPVLTSTLVADEELGAAALRRLIHRFDYPEESQRSILLPAKLAIGETTRKLPSR